MVSQQQPLEYAMSEAFKRLSIPHTEEGGASFTADKQISMNVNVSAMGIRHAVSAAYKHKGLLVDVIHAGTPMRPYIFVTGVKLWTAKLASYPTRAKSHTTLVQGVFPSMKVAFNCAPMQKETLGVRKTENNLVDQLVTHIVGGTDVGTMHMKGIWKERLLQNTSVTTQVEISRRVKRFKLDLGDKQELNSAPSEGGRYWLQPEDMVVEPWRNVLGDTDHTPGRDILLLID